MEPPVLIVGGAGKTGRRVDALLTTQQGIATRPVSRSTTPSFDRARPENGPLEHWTPSPRRMSPTTPIFLYQARQTRSVKLGCLARRKGLAGPRFAADQSDRQRQRPGRAAATTRISAGGCARLLVWRWRRPAPGHPASRTSAARVVSPPYAQDGFFPECAAAGCGGRRNRRRDEETPIYKAYAHTWHRAPRLFRGWSIAWASTCGRPTTGRPT
jgi:hypothetical protein